MQLLKELILGRKYSFESKLSAEDFLFQLKNSTASPYGQNENDNSKAFLGKIKKNKFWIRRHLRIRKAFTPFLSGTVTPTQTGCRLEGKIKIDSLILFILGIWFILFFSIAILFISYSGMDEAVDFFMLFPLLFIFLILFMIVLMAGSEIARLEEDLENILQFHIIEDAV